MAVWARAKLLCTEVCVKRANTKSSVLTQRWELLDTATVSQWKIDVFPPKATPRKTNRHTRLNQAKTFKVPLQPRNMHQRNSFVGVPVPLNAKCPQNKSSACPHSKRTQGPSCPWNFGLGPVPEVWQCLDVPWAYRTPRGFTGLSIERLLSFKGDISSDWTRRKPIPVN